jgi:heme exporter protein A
MLECRYVSGDRIRLQIDHVGKTYGTRRVLQSVCADLAGGDTLVVTGRNGAGKSTLLRIIAGLLRPSQGQVHVWADGIPVRDSARRHVLGFVGADVHLYRELTAREHLRLLGRLRNLPMGPAESTAALEQVGLGGREDEQVGGFSSGMQQRLRYALALLHRPRLLLLDEPTTNLDAAGIAIVDRIIRDAASSGIVILATNDPRELRYGELVLALDEAAHG